MAFAIADRVQEVSSTTGTGTFLLTGAVTGYQSFAVIGNTNTTYYTIADQSGTNWEVGIGTYYSSNVSLARTTILSSSNANAVVNFGAGTKSVFVTYPAERAIYADSSNITTVTNLVSGNVSITGGTLTGVNVTATTFSSANVNITGGTENNVTYTNVTVNSGTVNNIVFNNVSITGGSLNNVVIGNVTPAAATFTNITSSGASRQFAADFSNATVANRFTFTTSAANANPGIYAVPSGTGTAASWQAANNANITNASKILIASNGTTDVQLVSGINGTGTYLPLAIWNNGGEKMRVAVSGNVGIGNTNPQSLLTVAGQIESTATGYKFPDATTQPTSATTGNAAVVLNSTNATSNGTIGAGYNGFSVGPVTVANNVTITVASGQRWIII
jgi:hypothetical protein